MALVKFGNGVSEIRGSIGGNTYSRNRFGAYIRKRTAPTQPQSSAQVRIRSIISTLAEYWHDGLTSQNRTDWEAMAANIPFINSLGDVYYLTGMQMFIRSNTLNVFLNGVDSIQDEPPAVHALADKDESLTISASAATQEISVAFNNSMDWADEVGGQMYIYQSTPQKQTINFFKGPYSYLDHIAGGQPGQPPTSPQDFTSLYTIAQNQRIFVQIRFQRADMRLSEVLRVNCVVGA